LAGGFSCGQTAKAGQDRRVQSLPFLGGKPSTLNESMPLAEWLLCQNLNPAKAVAIVLIRSTDARSPKLFKRYAKF
jgi:hypothetical protein